jgi:hypothetical protein
VGDPPQTCGLCTLQGCWSQLYSGDNELWVVRTVTMSWNILRRFRNTLLVIHYDMLQDGDPWISLSIEERLLLGCDAVWLLRRPTFQRNVSPPSSG